ncbi:hypothetical protein ACWDF9_25185 [Streptomyces rubiginosohelvolus]
MRASTEGSGCPAGWVPGKRSFAVPPAPPARGSMNLVLPAD